MLVDCIILGAVGFILAALFSDIFIGMGSWAKCVGLSLSVLYFSLFESSVAGGQSVVGLLWIADPLFGFRAELSPCEAPGPALALVTSH